MALSRKRFPNNISIAKKTAILIAVTTLGILFLGAFGHLGLSQLKTKVENLYQNRIALISSVNALEEVAGTKLLDTLATFSTATKELETTILDLKEAQKQLGKKWQKIRTFPLSKELPGSETVQKMRKSLADAYHDVDTGLQQGIQTLQKGEIQTFLEIQNPALIVKITRLLHTSASLVNLHKELYRLDKEMIDERYHEIVFELAFMTLFLLLFALFFTSQIVKSIKHLIHGLSSVVERKTREYQELNHKLEEKIRKVVEKNREKDQIMYQHARLAAMGEMIGNIAHQWRQPLNALTVLIQSFGTKSISGKLDQEFIDKQVSEGLRLAMQMSDTIEDFRNFFSPRKEREYFSVLKSLEDTLELVEYFCKDEHIEIKIVCKEDIRVYGYANEFAQVILNLINNARDNFKQRNINEDRKIVIKVEKKNKPKPYAFISFVDNGGGVDPAIIDRIFEPYFTTKHKSAGTGIGLYMSKQIIEKQMQGLITVKNIQSRLGGDKPYRCAQFIIAIPLK